MASSILASVYNDCRIFKSTYVTAGKMKAVIVDLSCSAMKPMGISAKF